MEHLWLDYEFSWPHPVYLFYTGTRRVHSYAPYSRWKHCVGPRVGNGVPVCFESNHSFTPFSCFPVYVAFFSLHLMINLEIIESKASGLASHQHSWNKRSQQLNFKNNFISRKTNTLCRNLNCKCLQSASSFISSAWPTRKAFCLDGFQRKTMRQNEAKCN